MVGRITQWNLRKSTDFHSQNNIIKFLIAYIASYEKNKMFERFVPHAIVSRFMLEMKYTGVFNHINCNKKKLITMKILAMITSE